MSRLVQPMHLVPFSSGGAREEREKSLERIAKYIPAEILAFYTLWTQATASLPWQEHVLAICVAGAAIGVIVTYVYFDRFFPGADPQARRFHRLISPAAFAVYSYTILGSVVPEVFVSGIALLATALITLVSAIAVPK